MCSDCRVLGEDRLFRSMSGTKEWRDLEERPRGTAGKMLEGPGSVDQETESPGSRSRVGGELSAGKMLQDYE